MTRQIGWPLVFISGWTRTSMAPVAVSATHSEWLVTTAGLSGVRLTMLLRFSQSRIREAWHVLCFEPPQSSVPNPQRGCLICGHMVTLLRFKIRLVLAGLYVAQPLELAEGLRVYPLPISSEGLPLSMPDADWNRVSYLLGHPVLDIDAHTSPVFFQPPGDEGSYPPLETTTVLRGATVATFLTALSLVSNRRVAVAWSWNDYGDAATFATGSPSGLAGPGPMTAADAW